MQDVTCVKEGLNASVKHGLAAITAASAGGSVARLLACRALTRNEWLSAPWRNNIAKIDRLN